MAPARRKGSGRASAAAAAQKQWKVGDLVLAKMKGFPAWPAMVSEPEKWGYSSDRKKLLVYFYGTKQIAFCNYADVDAFTEDKKKSLLTKRQGKGADFVRAVDEIVDIYEKLKRQNDDKNNSGDEGTVSSAGNSEGSKSKSCSRSPELSSHVTHNHQSEALHVLRESDDVLNSEEIPATSMEGDLHDINTERNEPTGTISILDQLRQTPLATTSNSRKRLTLPQNGAIQTRVPSLRRSRSSSIGNLHKFQKSTMMLNASNSAGSDLGPDVMQEESTVKDKPIGKVSHSSVSCDIMPGSAGLPLNETSEDILSETASLMSEPMNLNGGTMLESSCKAEHPGNGYPNGVGSNGDVRLNNKLDFPMNKAIHKKKRNPNRKRVSSTPRCAKLNHEPDSQVELCGSLSESPNFCNEAHDISLSLDGDEHLPLVKRARVRMSKPPVEEARLDEIVGNKASSDTVVPTDKSDKYTTSSSSGNNCPANRTLSSVKEALSSSPVNDCTLSSGGDMMFWKAKKYHSKGIALHVEAALPPSKRLHRALEAMSANAAEDTDDRPEAPVTMELISNNCLDSPKTSSLHLSTDGTVGSPARSQSVQPSDRNAFHSNASILVSSLTSQNLEVPTITSPELKPAEIPTENLGSCNKGYSRVRMNVKDCDGSSISEVVDTDVHDKSLKPCSLKLTEKPKNATSNEGITDQLLSSKGMSDQLLSPLREENANQMLQPKKKRLYSRVDNFGGAETVRSFQKSDLVLNSMERDDLLPLQGVAPTLSAAVSIPSASNTYGATKSSISQSNENSQARDMQDVAKEIKHNATPKDWVISPDLTPMKDLIAAAQAKRLSSRSTSFSDNTVGGKGVPYAVVSPSQVRREEYSGHGSPPNLTIYHTPASDDSTYCQPNDSRSPYVGSRQKGSDKVPHVDANASRKTFEALLCTLSRTKESIGRATRLAIECAKYGFAGEVVEILLQNLEREPSLHRRVDLFFLVDSITQCSRCQKGGPGDVYPSLVQSVLPRLLSAAAPPGNAAWENRRQCLKVLRVWLERKTLQESIVRHHMRELESLNEASFNSAYSRRPSRTERALNDPIREMEGMLVDEYGSNTSFQLPSFLRPCVLEDEEGSSDDERSFEAVTPESNPEVNDEKETTQISTEKHRHVLEDVDGELEMEDLAPPCEVEASSTCQVTGADSTVSNTHHQLDHHHLAAFAPPLPEDMPPSPPPLPSSPPPTAPSCSAHLPLVPKHQPAGSHALADVSDFHLSSVTNSMQNLPPQTICQQPSNIDANLMSSEPVSYFNHGYGGLPKQLPPPPAHSLTSSSSYGNPPGSHPDTHTGNKNCIQPLIGVPFPNKTYNLQPPPPTVSNQFSYVQDEPRHAQQSWGNCSSLTDRFQYAHDNNQRGNFYDDRSTRRPIQHEIPERGRFSAAVHLDKVEAPPVSRSHYGPPSEPSTIPCRGWPLPTRTSNYSLPASRPSLETPISRVAGAPGYWRPR